MKNIRIVINKDGSETAYIPLKFASLFSQIIQAGETDLRESLPEDFDDVPNPLITYERR